MKVYVKMLAFERSAKDPDTRLVEIPDAEAAGKNTNGLLSLAFQYGQNDFQPRQCFSVSVGDVIVLNSKFYMVLPCGFKEISADEFRAVKSPSSLYAWELMNKSA